jgi:hypothetical protein
MLTRCFRKLTYLSVNTHGFPIHFAEAVGHKTESIMAHKIEIVWAVMPGGTLPQCCREAASFVLDCENFLKDGDLVTAENDSLDTRVSEAT